MAAGSSDPVMLELFGAEVEMHLPALSEGLLALEKGRAGKKEIESMMRAAHSIKGAARIVGNESAVRVSHLMEDCFTAAKEDRLILGSDAVDVLLQGLDALQRICAPEPDPAVDEAFIQATLGRIATVREGKPPASKPPQAASVLSVAQNAPTPAELLPAAPATFVLPRICDDAAAESLRVSCCDIFANPMTCLRIDFGQVEQLSVAVMSLIQSVVRQGRTRQPPAVVEAHAVAAPIRTLFRVIGLDIAIVPRD